MPSVMNCTASAARITPDRRFMTAAPVTPSIFMSRGAASISGETHRDHERDHRQKTGEQHGSPPYLARGQQNGRKRSRSRDERKREGKHRDVLAFHGFFVLGRGRSRPRRTRKHHVERDQKEERAPGDAEGVKGNPHNVQKLCPHQREQDADPEGDRRRLEGHEPLIGFVRPFRQTGEQRDERDRLHHDEKDHEEFYELLDQVRVVASRKIFRLREGLIES